MSSYAEKLRVCKKQDFLILIKSLNDGFVS